MRPIIFSLEPAPPFALELTVWALRRWPDNEVDRWDGETLSYAIVERGLEVEALTTLDDDTAIDRLLQLRGVGRWTAEYIRLRGLGRLLIFPGDDILRASLASAR